jgi:hypothetical protein
MTYEYEIARHLGMLARDPEILRKMSPAKREKLISLINLKYLTSNPHDPAVKQLNDLLLSREAKEKIVDKSVDLVIALLKKDKNLKSHLDPANIRKNFTKAFTNPRTGELTREGQVIAKHVIPELEKAPITSTMLDVEKLPVGRSRVREYFNKKTVPELSEPSAVEDLIVPIASLAALKSPLPHAAIQPVFAKARSVLPSTVAGEAFLTRDFYRGLAGRSMKKLEEGLWDYGVSPGALEGYRLGKATRNILESPAGKIVHPKIKEKIYEKAEKEGKKKILPLIKQDVRNVAKVLDEEISEGFIRPLLRKFPDIPH